MILYMRITLHDHFLNWQQVSQLQTLDTNIRALFPCKIKVALQKQHTDVEVSVR